MYATGAGTPLMIAVSWPSRVASVSCACFKSVMSWPTTYSPFTVPSKLRSGTQRARIQRSRPLASMTARSYVIASPANVRLRPGSIIPARSGPPTSSVVLPTTSSRARPTRCRNASLTNW